jgi:DNA (cytosine-5)-methyltransferase 1
VLDAQFCGVAQRRRRVFVVGYLGDWRPAAAVLFERHSLRRDLAPSRTAGKEPSAYFESSLAQYREGDIGGTLKASGGVLGGGSETFLVQKVYENHAQDSRLKQVDVCPTVAAKWGTGGGNVPLVQAFRKSRRAQSVEDYETWVDDGISNTINLFDQGDIRTTHAVVEASARVRRLTPIECERLQGFPDGFTNIPWRKKDTSPEGLRYKALGNSMAVPCMQWIGDGIDLVDKL